MSKYSVLPLRVDGRKRLAQVSYYCSFMFKPSERLGLPGGSRWVPGGKFKEIWDHLGTIVGAFFYYLGAQSSCEFAFAF